MSRRQQILIVDNNLHISHYPQGYLFKRLFKHLPVSTTIIRADDITGSEIKYDKVILTGSTSNVREERSWMKKEKNLITNIRAQKIPLLGICFGAQLIAQHIYGDEAVQSMPIPISGSISCSVEKNIPLFSEVPSRISVTATHYEGFIIPPQKRIATTKEWPSYGFKIDNKTYGIQFHPELMNPFGKKLIQLQRLIYDRHVYQDFTLPVDKEIGKKILENFITKI